ncbi:MAG: Magnesium and cobalt efflux protein CorC [Acidimicrobiales bacterium]|nr:Magnesium and cobalt efflux protein CorC [Acidimicrobiales bacterium]
MGLDLAIVAGCLLVNALLAGSEIAFVSLRDTQLTRIEQRGDRGRVLATLARDPTRFLTTIQLGINLAGFLASASVAQELADRLDGPLEFLGAAAGPVAFVLVLLGLTYLTMVLGELAPKRLAMQRAESWGLIAARPIAALDAVARPVVWLVGRSVDLVVRVLGGNPSARSEDVTEEEVRDLIATSVEDEEQRTILSGAFEAAERTLREIVVPRSQVLALPLDAPATEARAELVSSGHTRAPVYAGDLDDVRGMVHLIDLLDAVGPVSAHVRPATVLPEAVSVLDALRRLRADRQQMAVVVNEHGATEGIVTVEDLLEEIVGDLYDEFDPDLGTVEREEGGALVLPGDYPVHDLPDLGVSLPEGPYATVAGYALARLGHIPEGHEQIEADGWRLEVLDVEKRAIKRVRLCPLPGGEEPSGSE